MCIVSYQVITPFEIILRNVVKSHFGCILTPRIHTNFHDMANATEVGSR